MHAGSAGWLGQSVIPPGILVLFALLLGLASPAAGAAPKQADTVFRNGYIYTVDQKNSVKQAVAIRNGKITYVGSNNGVRKFIGKRTKVTNLGGKMAMPGIVDAHNHVISAGARLLECDLNYESFTVSEFLDRIQGCLNETSAKEPDTWLVVSGWYRQAMSGPVTNLDLDGLTTGRPIFVSSSDGHTKLVNSRALAIAGITAATPDPDGGRIDHHPGGEPNGILEDAAGGLVSSKLPATTAEDVLEQAQTALRAMRADGVTSFMYQGAGEDGMDAFKKVAQSGDLTARASFAPNISLAERSKPNAAVKQILELQQKYSRPFKARPNLTLRNVGELSQDGVLQWPAQTASLLEPYLENVGTEANPNWQPSSWSGPDPYTPLPVLKKLTLALAKAGIEPEIHAIGDRAVHETLDAYQYVRKQLNKAKAQKGLKRAQKKLRKLKRSSASRAAIRAAAKRVKAARKALKKTDVRLLISHAEMVIPSDYARFRKLDVVPAMGFWWASPDFDSIDSAENYLGPERFNRMEPEGHLQRAGAKIALGSDWPVNALNSMYQLKVLVTREGNNPGEKYQGRLGTVPLVPIKPALRAMTINPAYGMHQDEQTGSLEVGKFADMIVLDRNLLKVDPRTIDQTRVLRTVVGGKTVYERK